MRIREGSQAKTGMAEEKETKGIDYQTWEFTGREYLEIAGISLGIAAAVNLLCYRAWWACIAVVPVGIVCFHTYRKNRIQRRKEELYDSFRDLIAWMHTALRSGYSMENAVLEAAGQLEQSLGKENILVQELRRMRHKMMIATVYKGNIIKNLIMDCQSYTKYRPNETTGGIFVSWRRKEELPTGA